MTAPWLLRPIRSRDNAGMKAVIREVMTEHGCTGAGFAIHDPEVEDMCGAYRPPHSGYYVVTRDADVFGGGGFARLAGSSPDDAICELRKMYFRAPTRGLGLGRELLSLLLDEMRLAGFRRCYLETTSWMERAQHLYRSSGFEEQPSPEGQTGHHGCDKFFSREL